MLTCFHFFAARNFMSPELHHLILTYGYWLMAFGALIEGETFLLAGGIAAQQGLLHIPGLIALALVGSVIHDCFFFYLGRLAGHKILDRKPQFKSKVQGILNLFDRYGVWLIIALRFAYSLRTIIPTVLGMSPISNRKFIFFDVIGGIIWSCTFILGGYFLGSAVERLLKSFNLYQHVAGKFILILIGLVIIALVGWWFYKRAKAKRANPPVEK